MMDKISNDIWDRLIESALSVQNGRTISPFVEAGGVAAAIESTSGKIYLGVCIDTCSALGMCAERAAIANMITSGEHKIRRVVAIMPDGKIGPPCGACRELMMQLSEESANIEILLDRDRKETVKLSELYPDFWGKKRYKEVETTENA